VSRTATEIFDISGRTAIVTGASSGIGEHMVRTLAAGGATVIAAARRVERLEALARDVDGVHAAGCDVTVEHDLDALVAKAYADTGRLDIVVNNAGRSDAPVKAEDESAEQFASVIDVNLNACFLLARRAASEMIAHGEGGSIINVASVHGFVSSAPNNQAAYVASKTGLLGLTRELASQWARHKIRVNCVSPGYFPTELTDTMMEEGSSGLGFITKRTPMRRPGRLEELDGALLLLASDASSYLTGQSVTVDGGWTMQ
jgi:NAD(P)-dependent dehydrogenase (short-subunit alcohol dehydrogenase family)